MWRKNKMLAFISFLLVIIGSLNWFCIGLLQYDFVAGIFGSQSNIFSRLVYTLVGIASIIVAFNLIKNKGKFIVSFKKANKEYTEYISEKNQDEKNRVLAKAESAEDFGRKEETEFTQEKNSDNSCSCNNCNCSSHSQDQKHSDQD